MKPRIIILFLGFATLWSLVIMRAAFLQFLPHEKLEAQKNRLYETKVTLSSLRGSIIDRNGKQLAVSVQSYSLFADPSLITNDQEIAVKLGRMLRMSDRNLRHKFKNKKRRFVWIRRHLSRDERDKIHSWGHRGLAFVEESKRIYPNDELLSQTLGFTGRGGRGLEGVELKQDELLHGHEKKIPVRRDARGRALLSEQLLFADLPNGSDVQLTVDLELQDILESELSRACRDHEATYAVGVILDAKTSEILAMATSPSYNPNSPQKHDALLRRNRVITDSFEPGSTIKTFAIAAALRKGIIKPNTKYYCENGRMKIGNRTIKESDTKHKWENLTVTEILAKSSNIGTTKIAFDLGAENFHEALIDFGFGQKSGVDFPGEVGGILHKPPWRKHLLSNISFGHGIAATPLQVANAYAAIANGGVLHKPYVIKSVKDSQTGEVTVREPEVLRRVLEPDQAEKLRLMLTEATSEEGTASNARVAGFPVAGKTGTAQKVNPSGRGYLHGEYISSFAGFIPAHDPRFVIYIAVDSPQKGYYGSQVAAPVFQAVASYAVRKAGLMPILLSQSRVIQAPASELELNVVKSTEPKTLSEVLAKVNKVKGVQMVPELTGLSLREVMRQIRGQDIKLNIRGKHSGQVSRTLPEAGESFRKDMKLTIWVE